MFVSCSRLGWRLANSSIAAEMSTEISRWMWRRVNPVNRSVTIDERRGVLILLSPLNDLSAEQLVTGSVHKIVTNALILGYIGVTWRSVTVRVEGKLASPFSLSSCCHFNRQQCSSLWTHSGDGKSSLYISASCMVLVVYSSVGTFTRMEGMMEKPNRAVFWCELKRDSISESRWSRTGMDMQRQ